MGVLGTEPGSDPRTMEQGRRCCERGDWEGRPLSPEEQSGPGGGCSKRRGPDVRSWAFRGRVGGPDRGRRELGWGQGQAEVLVDQETNVVPSKCLENHRVVSPRGVTR